MTPPATVDLHVRALLIGEAKGKVPAHWQHQCLRVSLLQIKHPTPTLAP